MDTTPTDTTPAASKRVNKKHIIGYAATALIALGIGGASGSADPAPLASPAPTVTVTAPAAEGQGSPATVTVAAPTVTQTVEAPAKTVTAAPPEPAVAMAGDGMYEVGVDVKPGTYVSKAPDTNCYWARLSSTDGFDGIITNNNSSGQSVVTIKKSDKFFESNGCSDWTKR